MKINSRFCSLLLATAVLGSSCATSGLTLQTEDEVKTMRQAQLTHGVGGAAVGAALGAGLMALQGGNSSDIWKGAGVGALAGGIAGTAHGNQRGGQVVQHKREAQADEAYLTQAMTNAKKFNSALLSYNAKVESQIASLRSAPNPKTAKAAKRQAQSVVRDVDKELKTRESFISDSANSAKKEEMASSKSELEARRNKLNDMVATLEALEATPAG